MRSSTSSSRFKRLFQERMLVSAALTAFLAVAVLLGLFPLSYFTEILPELSASRHERRVLWHNKANSWGADYDIILLGDSRVYRGISPKAMSKALPNMRIANYGFSGAGLNTFMFDKGAALLDPSSKRQVIVLGVTPLSLTPHAARQRHIRELIHQTKTEIMTSHVLGSIPDYLPRITLTDLRRKMNGKQFEDTSFLYTPHPDGWIATQSSRIVQDGQLQEYKKIFTKTQVDPQYYEELFKQVRQWSDKGIKVFGFRPPVAISMYELENDASGFDENHFVEGFTRSGGIWLDYRPDSFESYDGNHLHEKSARAFSEDIASRIAVGIATPAKGKSQ